ncbi:hypothetical protein [Mycobacterium sp.]|uniref:hypothetical protein n=1 Tax=Mycobacterium sp. TaxID=1785 RepID=UPI003BAC367D
MTAIADSTTRPRPVSADSLLRLAMRADAALTALMGLVAAFAAGPISSITGLTSAQEYSIGAFFVLYGAVVFGLAALPKVPHVRRAGIAVIAGNTLYTVAAIVAVELVSMTAVGVAVTLATGVYTALFAVLQYLGVRRICG